MRDLGLRDAAFAHIAKRDELHFFATRIARMEAREKSLWCNRMYASMWENRQEYAQHRKEKPCAFTVPPIWFESKHGTGYLLHAVMVLVTIPLCLVLRPVVAAPVSA